MSKFLEGQEVNKIDHDADLAEIDPITEDYLKDNEIHSSDCGYWIDEYCDCIMGKIAD